MTSLENKINRAVLRQMRADMNDAHEKYLRNHGNDEADYQDFKFKQDVYKRELSKK